MWRHAVSAALTTACASAPAPGGAASPEPSSHPPALAVDPVLLLPRPADSAPAERGLVVLTEPVDTRSATHVVEEFFAAVVAESLDDLSALCENSAHTRVSSRSRPERLAAFWQKRFERLDYGTLATEVFYRPADMEVHTARDASSIAASRGLPALPKGADVLVRTPMVGSNSSRLFGSDLVFLLRRGPAGYKIAEVFEDFRLP